MYGTWINATSIGSQTTWRVSLFSGICVVDPIPNLTGRPMPSLQLPSTAGGSILLSSLGNPLTVLYLSPLTARPGTPLPDHWHLIPGAPGCSRADCPLRDP